MRNIDQFESGPVEVGDSPTVLAERVLSGLLELANIEVANAAGGAALNSFAVQLKDHPGGEWYDFLEDGDFEVANDNILFCSTTTPHDLAAGAAAHVHIRVNAAHAIRLVASTASGTADVTARVTLGAK